MYPSRRIALGIAVLTILAGPSVRAEAPPPVAKTPEEVGMSSAQLKRIEAVSQAHVDTGLLPGAQMLVVRKGRSPGRRALVIATAMPRMR